jgi:uncharacterized protein (DUF2062 family)
VLKPIKQQLTRGTSKEKIALTMAISPVVSAFPVLGTTNLVSLFFGTILRLNLPFLLLFKSLFYPLHLGLILVFIRIGETINGAPHIPFSIPQLLVKFNDDPMQFARDFGMTALYGIEAWAIIAPWFAIPLYFIFLHLIKKYMNRKSNRTDA